MIVTFLLFAPAAAQHHDLASRTPMILHKNAECTLPLHYSSFPPHSLTFIMISFCFSAYFDWGLSWWGVGSHLLFVGLTY